jgi:hypothetical protein
VRLSRCVATHTRGSVAVARRLLLFGPGLTFIVLYIKAEVAKKVLEFEKEEEVDKTKELELNAKFDWWKLDEWRKIVAEMVGLVQAVLAWLAGAAWSDFFFLQCARSHAHATAATTAATATATPTHTCDPHASPDCLRTSAFSCLASLTVACAMCARPFRRCSSGKPAFEHILANLAYASLLTFVGLLWLVAPGLYSSDTTDTKKHHAHFKRHASLPSTASDEEHADGRENAPAAAGASSASSVKPHIKA